MNTVNAVRRILVPTDFSPPADEAARYAVELAGTLGASVTLLHAWQPPLAVPFPDGPAYVPSPAQLKELEATALVHLRELKHRLARPGVEIALLAVEGLAKQLVPRLASEEGFDLVVVGTHGRTGLAHLVLGSVAEAIVRHSPCPVITVPAKGKHAARSPSAPIL